MMPQFPELMHCAVPRDRSGQSDTGATAEMPIIYDVIQLASGTPWVTDGSTFNVVTQSEMTLIEPVNVTDVDGDGFISLGDTFNGSSITEIGKFGGQITYEFGASTINRSAHFVTTSDGFTYLLQPDGITLEGITEFNVIAESGGKATQIGLATSPPTTVSQSLATRRARALPRLRVTARLRALPLAILSKHKLGMRNPSGLFGTAAIASLAQQTATNQS